MSFKAHFFQEGPWLVEDMPLPFPHIVAVPGNAAAVCRAGDEGACVIVSHQVPSGIRGKASEVPLLRSTGCPWEGPQITLRVSRSKASFQGCQH